MPNTAFYCSFVFSFIGESHNLLLGRKRGQRTLQPNFPSSILIFLWGFRNSGCYLTVFKQKKARESSRKQEAAS